MDGVDFAEIRIGEKPAADCEYFEVPGDQRLYYVPRGDGNGFDFMVLRYVSSADSSEFWEEAWESEWLLVEPTFHGIAYYDGVRHLYMGHKDAGNLGCLYCLRTREATAIFQHLRSLEERYCSGIK